MVAGSAATTGAAARREAGWIETRPMVLMSHEPAERRELAAREPELDLSI